jgi:phage terminase large subunit-like protein
VSIRGRYGRSAITLRAYSQSKTGQATLSFAGSSIDLVWVDECPPDPLVGQLVTRTMTGCGGKGGRIKFTMTPELGVTNLVDMFMNRRGPDMHLVGPIAWSQCPHLTPEVQESILAAIPDHEREMRSKGIPFFGSGLVYPVPESRLLCEPFRLEELPWGRTIRAMDLGIDHPTAAVWLLWDPEFDVIYVTRDYSRSGEPAAVHASILNSFMQDAPVVFPPDVDQTEKGSGKTVRTWYAEAGLKNTRDFENPDGTRYVEPGIMEILERMKTDRLKIFRGCDHLLRELRLYHRKDGSLVKQNDDVLDALRYGVQMIKRHGTPISRGHRTMKKVKRAMDA